MILTYGIVYTISEYVFELFQCQGPSMMPTIQPRGEIIFVDRFGPRLVGLRGGSCGVRRAQLARQAQDQQQEKEKEEKNKSTIAKWHEPMLPPSNMLPSRGRWKRLWNQWTSPLSIGDVLIVQHPHRPGTVCKRLLGLPGDTVILSPQSPLLRQQSYNNNDNNAQHLLVIPNGHIWVEGDNLVNSSDSRHYGPVPASLIVGRVVGRIWPLRRKHGTAFMERASRPVATATALGMNNKSPSEQFIFFGGQAIFHRDQQQKQQATTILPAGYEGEDMMASHHVGQQWEQEEA